MLWPSLPFFDSDSGGYLLPPFMKVLHGGGWHKGERPMQYLLFLHWVMTGSLNISHITIAQHFLGLCAGLSLFLCFILVGRTIALPYYINFPFGIALLWLYLFNPNVLYYEHFIGPECYSMFLESILVLSLSAAMFYRKGLRHEIFLMLFIFLNLFISNPMPKFFLASIATEICVFVWLLKSTRSVSQKRMLLLVPHVVYVVLVFLPEYMNKPDTLGQDRVSIEWRQMSYTHFDILMNDTASLNINSSLKTELLKCYSSARGSANYYRTLGFNSDELMWGRANDRINAFYNDNEDSVNNLYRSLVFSMAEKHPFILASHIIRQITGFYLPGHLIRFKVWCNYGIRDGYSLLLANVSNFDNISSLDSPDLPPAQKRYRIGPLYPADYESAGFTEARGLPLLITDRNFVYVYFDWLFFGGTLLFFLLRFLRGVLLKFHIAYFIHLVIFFYVLAVGTVHTFDIDRFVHTIFPLLLLCIFLEGQYILLCIYTKLNPVKLLE
jgi:hypothetical protein